MTRAPRAENASTSAESSAPPVGVARADAAFAARVGGIAAALGERRGDVWILCSDRAHFAAALLAAWSLGRPVALPPNGQVAAVAELLHESDDFDVVHDGGATAAFGGIDAARLAPARAAAWAWPADDAHVATLYTSGSTAAARPVTKTAGQLVGEARALAQVFGIGEADVVLATVPPQHIYGLLFGVLLPLVADAGFVRDTPLHAETVARRAAESAATVLVSTPAHLATLGVLDEGALPPALRIFSSGAPLRAAAASALLDRQGIDAIEVLGSTETGGIAHRPASATHWSLFPSHKATLDDDGRMQLDSPWLPPDAPRPWTCADRFSRDSAGWRHLGRADDVVKLGGKRVSLGAVEARLRQLEDVTDAVVQAVPLSGARGVSLRAAVAMPERRRPVRALRRELADWLDPVALPRPLIVVEALGRTPSGKLPRRVVDALFDRAAITLRGATNGAAWSGEATVGETTNLVAGHFPAMPILPGVALVDRVVVVAVARAWPELAPESLSGARRVKFRHPVYPGDTLEITLERIADRRVRFALERSGEPVADGVLDWRP